MPAPPPRTALLAAAAACLLCGSLANEGEELHCKKDGLFPDYETDCTEYYRCVNGTMSARYTCSGGRTFSAAEGACVVRGGCVRLACEGRRAHATPGTACRRYYRCERGEPDERACPAGAWFDSERQACSRGAGTCFEPLCAGLPDGEYPDASHDCRRAVRCRGGQVRAVGPCAGPGCEPAACPPRRAAAVPLPAGDADLCAGAACASMCELSPDGAHADRASGCREYFECAGRRVIRRGVCEPGWLFSEGRCQPAARVACSAPALSPCFARADGPHRDWRDCSSWFECRRERVVSRGSCGAERVFDGARCVATAQFPCEGPHPAAECEARPSGVYPHLGSGCTRYFHCAGPLRTLLSCPAGQRFDGERCAADADCPAGAAGWCAGRGDGRLRAPGAGCRAYVSCAGGEVALSACPPGQLFDGEDCVQARPGLCPHENYSCANLTDGYHAEIESNCHRYFYCEGGDRLSTLSCLGGKIFDGRACVDTSQHTCGKTPRDYIEAGSKPCQRDGFFLIPSTDCQQYYFCVNGTPTYLTCPADQTFNGQICVPKSQYTCPG